MVVGTWASIGTGNSNLIESIDSYHMNKDCRQSSYEAGCPAELCNPSIATTVAAKVGESRILLTDSYPIFIHSVRTNTKWQWIAEGWESHWQVQLASLQQL